MIKRVCKTGSITLLSRDDQAYLKAFREFARVHVDKVTRTRETAIQELIDAGIFSKNGKPKKRYRSVA